MVALTSPNSITGQTLRRNRASDVPPVVEGSGSTPVSAFTAAAILSLKAPGGVRNGSPLMIGSALPIISGEPFLTPPGAFSDSIAAAVKAETGVDPEPSTTGGTSDARFLRSVCPVIEFGLVNATMHKTNEAVAVEDLAALGRIYARIARDVLAGQA